MAYGDFRDLTGITAFDKRLHDKPFNIAKNLQYDGYQRGIYSMVYKPLDKHTFVGATRLANKSSIQN